MYKNNLTELLKTFSGKELKDFREFLDSDYFNKRKAVNSLYNIVIKFHPDFENKNCTKQYIFGKLFPGKIYNDSTLRVLTHYLTELAEKFLAIQRFESNETEFSLHLNIVLFERKQYKLFEKNINQALNKLNIEKPDAEEFYFYKFRLENLRTYYQFASNYAYFDKMLSKPDWESVFKDLTNFYLLKSMTMYLNTLNLHNLYKKEFQSQPLISLINNIDPDEYEDIPEIRLYYYLIKLNTDGKHETFYFKLKEILSRTKKVLNNYDLMGAYVNMGSYCINRIKEGNTAFEKERFYIYKEELKEKTYLMNDNTMSPLFYRNVVNSGLRLKEFNWIKNFINDFKSELHIKFRDNYYYYCFALYEFNLKNFEKSLEIIAKIKYDELYMKLSSKMLHLQVLYELGFEETLISNLENFRHFLNNDKLLPEEKKKPLISFYKYLSKILSGKALKSKSETGYLKDKISKEISLANKGWLLEKILKM